MEYKLLQEMKALDNRKISDYIKLTSFDIFEKTISEFDSQEVCAVVSEPFENALRISPIDEAVCLIKKLHWKNFHVCLDYCGKSSECNEKEKKLILLKARVEADDSIMYSGVDYHSIYTFCLKENLGKIV